MTPGIACEELCELGNAHRATTTYGESSELVCRNLRFCVSQFAQKGRLIIVSVYRHIAGDMQRTFPTDGNPISATRASPDF